MELDKKIKVKKIFDCFSDFEEVKKYYGKEVYCADFIENFSNLKLYTDRKILKMFFQQECKPFVCSGQQYRFILPAEFVEQEKQYRAFTLDEFLNHFDIGEVIVFRSKVMPNIICHVLFDGYMETGKENDTSVILGQHRFSLQELFSSYEYCDGDSDNWLCFGVEE
jgi:hypothetical protein